MKFFKEEHKSLGPRSVAGDDIIYLLQYKPCVTVPCPRRSQCSTIYGKELCARDGHYTVFLVKNKPGSTMRAGLIQWMVLRS